MKTITTLRSFPFLILSVIILIAGCEGEEGPMGPVGPMGPKGDKGDPGTSDIKSVIYEVNPKDWNGNSNGYSVFLDIPEITSNIFYNGAVLVYMLREELNPPTSNLLPYTWIDGTMTEYMDADVYVGGAKIFFRWTDNGINSTKRPEYKYVYKIVIFEGISITWLKEHVNINSIQSVEEYFHVKLNVF